MKKINKYLLFAVALFSLFLVNTKATTSPVGRGNIIFNDSTWFSNYGYWGVNVVTSGTNVNVSFGCDLDSFSCVKFSALVLDVCSEDSILVSRTSDYATSCNGSCFSQNFILKDMRSYCKTNSGNEGFQFRLYLPVSKWNVGSGNTRLWSVDDTIKIRSKNYNALVTIFGAYYTDENITSDGYDFSIIDGQIKNTNSKLDDVNKNQKETNSKLDEAENTRKGILGTIKDVLSNIINLPKKIVEFLVDALKSLFVPTDEQLYEIVNDSKELSENFGFVGQSMSFFINIFTSLLGMVNANGCIEMPAFKIGATSLFDEHTFWDARNVCLADNLILSANINTIRTITSIVFVSLFVGFATRKFFSILSKSENEVNSE